MAKDGKVKNTLFCKVELVDDICMHVLEKVYHFQAVKTSHLRLYAFTPSCLIST